MRTYLFIVVLLICLAVPTLAAGRPDDNLKTARAEVSVLPRSDVQGQAVAAVPRVQDFRDSAALVLVGTMLLGLAAAVRRTV